MSFLDQVIDQAKDHGKLASDSELAERLGIGRQSVSKWRTGEAWPRESHIEELAKMAGISPVILAMGIEAERAGPTMRRHWLDAVRALSRAAAIAVVGLLPYWPASADAGPTSRNAADTVYYVVSPDSITPPALAPQRFDTISVAAATRTRSCRMDGQFREALMRDFVRSAASPH